MSPTGKPRGRPKGRPRKVAESGSWMTRSRLSVVKQDSNLEFDELSSSVDADDDSDGDDVDNSDLLNNSTPQLVGSFLSGEETLTGESEKAGKSLSSVFTSIDNNEGSGYSTPETSDIPTPASTKDPVPPSTTTRSTRRGRSRNANAFQSTSASVIARAREVQNSIYSLNPTKKRKFLEDDDEYEDLDDDNACDAQLARALQEEEYTASNSLAATSLSGSRGITRNAQQSKLTFDADFSDDNEDDDDSSGPRLSRVVKKARTEPKVKLSRTSNAVNFTTSNRGKAVVHISDDDDDDDDFIVMDSDSDVPAYLPTRPTSRKKGSNRFQKVIEKHSQDFQNRLKTGSASKNSIKKEADKLEPKDANKPSAISPLEDLSSLSSEESLSDILYDYSDSSDDDDVIAGENVIAGEDVIAAETSGTTSRHMINLQEDRATRRARKERTRLEQHHPELHTMWKDLENLPKIGDCTIEQPTNINRQLKPFQLQGVGWMRAMEKTDWGGGLLGDEMGMGKTIQAVSLIMSDFPAKQPSLVLVPPVALMQWQQEIADYTDGTLKTFVFHGSNAKSKGITAQEMKKYNVILMSYNSLESMYRKQEKGFKSRSTGIIRKEKSQIHQIHFHRVILDEAHSIKQRSSGSAKACFALKANHKWCLSGTPLQNRIGEFFSLVRFLNIRPFACYFCKQCPCSTLEWDMNSENRCAGCGHSGTQHVSVFNQELLNPIQKFGNNGAGKEAFRKLRILTDRFMLRRIKRDHSSAMELPAKEIYVDRQFFGEEENDFAGSIMNKGARKFETYVAQGVLLNNYANIFGLIMQMRQVADHPDLILKRNSEGGQNILVCCICDEVAEEAIRSACRHDFCRECAKNYLRSSDSPDCPQCHIPLAIDLEQPEFEQDEVQVKKSSIINRIKMENWTSSSKIEALVHDLYQLRSKNSSTKSIIFSQFTTMLQLVEWRLRRAGITTVMLDGSMTPAQRQASINHFMTDVNVECFLVSLKAGGVALNLTEANKVFIVDPWWNPAAEWQSADRCHRIGQARPCSITRLCIEDSVESRMVLLQEKKANMIHSTINADESAMENLTPDDMQFLFRGN